MGRNFGPAREEVTDGWRNLHNDRRVNLHFSLNSIIVMVKSRKTTQTGNAVSMGWIRNTYTKVRKPEPKL